MAKVRVLLSESVDPWFNLATENWIFQALGDVDHVLFLWRNQDTVVIGRSQNPWAECNLEKMQQENVQLARRQSGGGAVFHDLGNTNFTFLSKKTVYERDANFNIIIHALSRLGIAALRSGRNDLVVSVDQQTRKFSGSAFKEKHDRAFHHGTLLVNADLSRLQQLLNPNPKKLEAKGVKSVRSRVMNLTELDKTIQHDVLCQHIVRSFLDYYHVEPQVVEIELLKPERLKQFSGLMHYYQQMQDWDWLYGQTMEFTHQFETRLSWGMIEVQLKVVHAIITDIRVYSDGLFPEMIEALKVLLLHCYYEPAAVSLVLDELQQGFPDLHKEINELKTWLLTSIQ